MFTTTNVAFTLVAGDTGVASQESNISISSDFETKSGRSLRGVTLARLWVRGLYFTQAVVTTPVVSSYFMGVGIFTQGVDDGDFPNLETHDGDWMLHDARVLIDTSVSTDANALNPEAPAAGSNVVIDNRSMRKIMRDTEAVFVVMQKGSVTEDNILWKGEITAMWLLP